MGNVLSVAISSQQLLLARATAGKRGGFYFSDIGSIICHSQCFFSEFEVPFESHYWMAALLYCIKQLL